MAALSEEVWRRVRAGDAEAREQAILHHLWLVRYVAGRLAMGLSARVEEAEMESQGILGLLDAVDRYDCGRGVRFETYAMPWIRGAILAGLRSNHWAPGLLRRARQLEKAFGELEATLHRAPTDPELARAMGISLEELHVRRAELGCVTILSLDEGLPEATDDGSIPLVDRVSDTTAPDPAAVAAANERREMIARALATLDEKERLVLTLYYYEELTLAEIAQVLSLTPARISQIHGMAILRLRGKLGRFKGLLVS